MMQTAFRVRKHPEKGRSKHHTNFQGCKDRTFFANSSVWAKKNVFFGHICCFLGRKRQKIGPFLGIYTKKNTQRAPFIRAQSLSLSASLKGGTNL